MNKKCPECGAATVVETHRNNLFETKERRCTGLVEVHPDKPLEACGWSEQVGEPKYLENFGVDIMSSSDKFLQP